MSHEATPQWMAEAACKRVPTEAMYPEPGDKAAIAAAKRICQDCVVIDDCLTYALARKEADGVWGGRSETERRTILRKRQRHGRKTA